MYATCCAPLNDRDTKQPVANCGDRVVLVYPMHEDADGIVSMRMKHVNKNTGQFSYSSVDVFNKVTDEAYVNNFSLLP
jgi:hypothetical protein